MIDRATSPRGDERTLSAMQTPSVCWSTEHAIVFAKRFEIRDFGLLSLKNG
jgi:hypothetical protein